MMNLSINQDNLYLLLPSKVSWLTCFLAEDENVSIVEALKKVYASELYREMEEEQTKKWYLGQLLYMKNLKKINQLRDIMSQIKRDGKISEETRRVFEANNLYIKLRAEINEQIEKS